MVKRTPVSLPPEEVLGWGEKNVLLGSEPRVRSSDYQLNRQTSHYPKGFLHGTVSAIFFPVCRPSFVSGESGSGIDEFQ